MTTQFEEITDTTGADGFPGAQPAGTQRVVSPKDTTSDGDGSARFGGEPYAGIAPVEQQDTSGTNGEGSLQDPVFTGYTNNADLTVGTIALVHPDYKAPSNTTPMTFRDTTGTDITGVGYDQDAPTQMTWLYQERDVYTIGAGAPGSLGTNTATLVDGGDIVVAAGNVIRDTVRVFADADILAVEPVNEVIYVDLNQPVRLARSGVASITSLELVDDIILPGDENVTLTSDELPVQLTQTGITSDLEDIVVTYDDGGGPDVLVLDTDYALSEAGSGASRTVSIAWISGGALPTGTEEVNVAYEYLSEGQALADPADYTTDTYGVQNNSYVEVTFDSGSTLISQGAAVMVTYEVYGENAFYAVRLTENIDFFVEYAGDEFTLHPVPGTEWEDAAVTTFYLYGTPQYLNASAPTSTPASPSGVVALKVNNFVDVQWEDESPPPATSNVTRGFIVEGSTGSRIVVPASQRSLRVPFLEHDREKNNHVTGGPETDFGTSSDYVFRVIAFNELGTSAPSAWTTPATSPTSWDQNPPAGIPYENRINPIYRADGTIVPGTGIGPAQ